MEILFVNNPVQDPYTISPQVINGKIYHWCVQTIRMKPTETFQEWLIRINEEFQKNKKVIKTIFVYDIIPFSLSQTSSNEQDGVMMIRCEIRGEDYTIAKEE